MRKWYQPRYLQPTYPVISRRSQTFQVSQYSWGISRGRYLSRKVTGEEKNHPPNHISSRSQTHIYKFLTNIFPQLSRFLTIVWWLFACLSQFLTIIWWLLIVLTVLGNFLTISNEFCINSCVQIEEYTHFYRFFGEKIPTHIVRTYPSDLHREYPPGPPWQSTSFCIPSAE